MKERLAMGTGNMGLDKHSLAVGLSILVLLAACTAGVSAPQQGQSGKEQDTAPKEQYRIGIQSHGSIVEAARSGQSQEAYSFYEKKAEELEQRGNRVGAASAHGAAARLAMRLGLHQKQIWHANRALELVEREPRTWSTTNVRLASRSLGGHGYLLAGALDRAHEYFVIGLQLARSADDRQQGLFWASLFLRSLAALDILHGDYAKGVRQIQEGIPMIEGLVSDARWGSQARRSLSYSWIVIADAHLRMEDLGDAEVAFRRALEVAIQAGLPETQVDALTGLGYVSLTRRDWVPAIAVLDEANRVASQSQDGQKLALISGGIGEAYAGQERHQDALVAFKRAMVQLESQRSQFRELQLRGSFLDNKLRIYHGAVRSALALGQPADAFSYAERSRARAFLDLLGHSERPPREPSGEGQPGPADDVLLAVEPAAPDEIQRRLPNDTTLLEYLVTDRETFLWVVKRHDLRAIRLPIRRAQLIDEVRDFRRAIAEGAEVPVIKGLARRLHEQLVAPAQSFLAGEVLIVPHDVLHYLPFAALRTGAGRWLVEQHTLATLPSASTMKYLDRRSPSPTASPLAVGNPELGPGLKLPYAQDEIETVRAHYPEATILTGPEATEAAVKAQTGRADILHFAAHAELNELTPLTSSLLLSPGSGEDGRLEVREILGLALRARLVVLSGCATGLGRLSRGDELVGLQRAFLYAGAHTIVATLWTVDDMAAYELMETFYAELQRAGPARALRAAQRSIMGRFAHPYFWAAFTFTGAPSARSGGQNGLPR
jgi:CHAT domain-containing protein